MISSASHDSVSRLVTDRSMCFAIALDKAFEKIDCMIAILSCQAKNRFYESTQRLIQPCRVLCPAAHVQAHQASPRAIEGVPGRVGEAWLRVCSPARREGARR